MGRHDESGPFARVGRIGIGRTLAVRAEGGGSVVWQVTLSIMDPHGELQSLAGTGADQAAAIAAAMVPLTRVPFVIESARATRPEAAGGRWSARALVRTVDGRRPGHAAGHAMAGDEPTAIAIATARGLTAGGFLRGRFLPAGARDVEG